MKIPKIEAVTAVRYPVLRIRFDDGFEGELDLTDLIARGGVFADLRDPEFFRQVAVDAHGHALGWRLDQTGNELDLGADGVRRDLETARVLRMAEAHRRRQTAAE